MREHSDQGGLGGNAERAVGHGASAGGRYTRLVDRFTVYREPMDFRSLVSRVLKPTTRYLLLDLDRTTHRGLNLGELLGWEIASYKFFGPELFAQLDAPRFKGRLVSDPTRRHRTPGYILDGARRWAFPGLSYLMWGKLTSKSEFLERWSYRKFGSEPIRAVQRLPQTALLHDIATLPKATLRELSQRVWDLASPMQVIERADLDYVRERCPGIRIILTSASPQPIVEVAGEMLGVDGIEYSVTRDLGDRYASPYWVDRRFALERIEQIAAPDELRINSGHAKIARLLEQYPDLLDQGVESVGISDTGYGEDHAWAQYFSVVVDVNSTTPFPPLVAHDSPLREVHSAQLRTRSDREAGSAPALDLVTLRAEDFARLLSAVQSQLERASMMCASIRAQIKPARDLLRQELARERAAIGVVVMRFNLPKANKERLLSTLRWRLRREAAVQRRLAALEQPLSYAFMNITGQLREARLELGRFADQQRTPAAQPELRPMFEASLA